MRWFLRIWYVMSLSCEVLSMYGGGDYTASDFAFTVMIKAGNPKKAVCMGVLDSESTFITASKCLKRVPPNEKTMTQFVSTAFNPSVEIPIMMVEPGKLGDAPEEGLAPFPDYATVIAKAQLPGVEVKAKDDLGNLTGAGPTYTPWPPNQLDFAVNITGDVSGIVAGMGNKAATVRVLSEKECDMKLRTEVPEDLNAFISANLEQNFTAADYFCTVKGADGGQFPAGYPCEEDLGAPFMVGDYVWGVLIGAWCVDDTNQTALFRTAVRSWDYRRFDGSLTDPPPTTKTPDMSTTVYNRDEPTKKTETGEQGGQGGAAHLLGSIYILILLQLSTSRNTLSLE